VVALLAREASLKPAGLSRLYFVQPGVASLLAMAA
jgi:hypothetical protein